MYCDKYKRDITLLFNLRHEMTSLESPKESLTSPVPDEEMENPSTVIE
jgi:hypothetical protein